MENLFPIAKKCGINGRQIASYQCGSIKIIAVPQEKIT